MDDSDKEKDVFICKFCVAETRKTKSDDIPRISKISVPNGNKSNILRHLKRYHFHEPEFRENLPEHYSKTLTLAIEREGEDKIRGLGLLPGVKKITDYFPVSSNPNTKTKVFQLYSTGKWHEALAHYASKSSLSIHELCSEQFKSLISIANIRAANEIPKKTKMHSLVHNLYLKYQKFVYDYVKDIHWGLSLMVDAIIASFTSTKNISSIKLLLLDVVPIESHKAISCDNASANESMIAHLNSVISRTGKFESHTIRPSFCFAHSINRVVQIMLLVLFDVIEKIRTIARKLHASPALSLKFKALIDQHNNSCSTLHKITITRLPLDVSTRWNSTCIMLKAALRLRDPINKFLEIEVEGYIISREEWKTFETLNLSGSQKVTISGVIKGFNTLIDVIEKHQELLGYDKFRRVCFESRRSAFRALEREKNIVISNYIDENEVEGNIENEEESYTENDDSEVESHNESDTSNDTSGSEIIDSEITDSTDLKGIFRRDILDGLMIDDGVNEIRDDRLKV
ncbi:unnamed protein product [Rotaria socialis]|uniref:Transposase n=1 Tax=Rotaria socialis TaxID=392032 RepID=A0A821V6U0_9BILA|nr:unnamed protein product [Rotaria socialis]